MKTVVCSLIFFLLAVGACGLRQKSATTVFRLVHPDGIEDYFDGRNLTWQERAVESMTGEYILQDVVKGRSLARRWGLTEPEAMEVLKRTVLIRLYEESDITSLTVWSSTFSEAAELADAIRDAY
ncbi:MAG TPA: hypothetical protein VHM91_05500, partial [Verrucomicrobiales bacterium]|nr:hypothetical protein [Verrucomicrobiales bacterium]